MPRFDYVLVVSMAISLIWGIIFFVAGCLIRFNLALFINNYIQDVDSIAHKMHCGTATGSLCPVVTDVPSDVNIGDWSDTIASFTIVVGFLVILGSIIGFIGGLKRHGALLILVILVDIAAMCFLYYLTHIVSSFTASWHEDAKEQLADMLRNEYTVRQVGDSQFTKLLNAFMLQGQCCGINGPDDFKGLNMSWYSEETTHFFQFVVAPACCKESTSKSGVLSIGYCASSKRDVHLWNKQGCYKQVYDYITEKYGATILGLLLFLAVWLAIQLVLAILTVLTPEPVRHQIHHPVHKVPSVKPSPKPVEMEERRQPERKRFQPYSKISSFTSSDVNRIKSTEIF